MGRSSGRLKGSSSKPSSGPERPNGWPVGREPGHSPLAEGEVLVAQHGEAAPHKRKQEAEAKRKQEEEAKWKQEEEAKRKQEEESKRKQEAEAKQKLEEEAKRQVDKENSQLEKLAEMGFTDKQQNISLLRQMRYDMH